MNVENDYEISSKLDTIIKILAANFVAGKNKTDAILLLNQVGLEVKEIAKLTNSTPHVVSVTIHKHKKKQVMK